MVDKNLSYRIDDAMREEFIGNYIFNDEDLLIIYDKIKSLFDDFLRYGKAIYYDDYDLVFVALVNFAKEWDPNKEPFWDFIYNCLKIYPNNQQKAYKKIQDIIDYEKLSKKIIYLDSYTKKYYATLCCHAFSPKKSLFAFLDICWKIYCDDLDFQYIKNNPDFDLIVKSFKNKFSNETNDEDFVLGSTAYSLRVGIKGLALDRSDLMYILLDRVIYKIHSLFHDEPVEKEFYIDDLIEKWWKDTDHIVEENVESCGPVARSYSQIRPKFIYEDKMVKLVIPPIRILEENSVVPIIEIKIGDEIILKEEMATKGSGILQATKGIKYDLSALNINSFVDFKIIIKLSDKIIYDSKQSLGRYFMLFNNDKEIVKTECLPGSYILFTKNISQLKQYPNDIQKISNNVYGVFAKEDEIIQSDYRTIFFSTETVEKDIIFFAKKSNDIIFRSEGEEYEVIDGEFSVLLKEDINPKLYGIQVDGVTIKLSDYSASILNDRIKIDISSLFNVGERKHIIVFKQDNHHIVATVNIIKFNNIKVIYDKNLYFGENAIGHVRFKTEKYDEETLFDISEKDVCIQVEDGEIIVHPPVLKWKIDNNDWSSKTSQKGLWYKELTNTSMLYLDVPKDLTCKATISSTRNVESCGEKPIFKLGQTIFALKAKGDFSHTCYTIRVQVDNKEYDLVELYWKETFINDPISIDYKTKNLIWNPDSYMGDPNPKFKLYLYDEYNNMFDPIELSCSSYKYSLQNFEEGYYRVKLVLIGSGFLSKDKELLAKIIPFGIEKEIKFKNKHLFISKIMNFKKVRMDIHPIYIDKIQFLERRYGYDCYSGMLYIETKEGEKVYLDKMGDQTINPLKLTLKSDSACYIGYGLEVYDNEYEIEDEFTLNSINQISVDSNSKIGIDFFIYEVKRNV